MHHMDTIREGMLLLGKGWRSRERGKPVVADGQVDRAVVAGALAQLSPARPLLPLVLGGRRQHLHHARHRTARQHNPSSPRLYCL